VSTIWRFEGCTGSDSDQDRGYYSISDLQIRKKRLGSLGSLGESSGKTIFHQEPTLDSLTINSSHLPLHYNKTFLCSKQLFAYLSPSKRTYLNGPVAIMVNPQM